MRSPADIPNPDDSDDSDGYYFSDSDAPITSSAAAAAAGSGNANGNGKDQAGARMAMPTAPVPEWSELETAVQALMGMDGGGGLGEEVAGEDGWDATESAR